MVVYCVFDNVQILQGLGVLGLQCFGCASGDTARQKRFTVIVKHSMREKLTLSDGHNCGGRQVAG
jgi:hypothetical protein